MTQEEGEGCLQLGEHRSPGRIDALPRVRAGERKLGCAGGHTAGVSSCGWDEAGHMSGPAGKVGRGKKT